MPLTLSGSTGIAGVDGSAGTPAVQGTDTNTGMFFPAADTIAFVEGGTEVMRIDSSGNVGIGTTSPGRKVDIEQSGTDYQLRIGDAGGNYYDIGRNTANGLLTFNGNQAVASGYVFSTVNGERARITTGGGFLVGKTVEDNTTAGWRCQADGYMSVCRNGDTVSAFNRGTNDGTIIDFQQAGTTEGSISVSGSTVSYNGGHLARWSQLPTNQRDPSLLKGTVLSNLDEMCVWLDEQGVPLPNEQLNKTKISDVEGDPNVAGVFVSWDNDDQTYTDDMNVAMTGDMIIRIAQSVVVQKGDLLMSAGDGTAKPQGDDIRRSKTVAKVTSNHVTCTYADGSYCVPCVLMAC